MTLRLQVIIGIMAIVAIIAICNLVRKDKMDLRYALGWIAVGIAIAVLDIWPGFLGMLTKLMGIELPINLLFFLGFCFSLIIIFGLTKTVSDLSGKVKKLTQELALLKEKLERGE